MAGTLETVDVAELPSFHNAFKCGLRDRFDQAIKDAREAEALRRADGEVPAIGTIRTRRWQVWRPTAAADDERQAEVRRVANELLRERGVDWSASTPQPSRPLVDDHGVQAVTRPIRAAMTLDEVQVCRYHRGADWAAIARAACDLVERHGGQLEHAHEAFAGLNEEEAGWACSLILDPIDYDPAEPELGNGQHRACALVVGGATRVPVETA